MSTKAYRDAHRAERAAYNSAWHAANRDRRRAFLAEHPEGKRAADAAYRALHREERMVWRAAHLEEALAREAATRAAHREELNARQKAYAAAHPERRTRTMAKWRAANRERVREDQRKAKAIRRGAPVCDHAGCLTLGAAQLAWQVNPHSCWMCGTPVWEGVNLHMDHVIPVSRGGVHCAENLRPACPPCNHRKYNRLGLA